MQKVMAIFKAQCPNCGGDIDNIRLQLKIPCKKCIPKDDLEVISELSLASGDEQRKKILEYLERYGTLKEYRKILALEEEVKEIEEIFEKACGSRLWSAQRAWCKRALSQKSFAMVAPTGTGKTTFGMILSLYLAKNGKKTYIILPTSLLVNQVEQKITEYKEKLNQESLRVVAYHALLTEKNKKIAIEKIVGNDYDILITTSSFLSRNYDKIKNKFDMIFVDDVDSFVKASKNVDKVLALLGIPREEIERAYKVIEGKESQTTANNEEENKQFGILIVSGASLRAKRSKKIRLIKHLLGFEIGGRIEGFRNVVDTYVPVKGEKNIIEKTVNIVKRLGGGGLIFVPMDKGIEYAKKLAEKLNSSGIPAETTIKTKRRLLERFRSGEYQILVGVASYRSSLARGIDLPETIRYAIFAGVPKMKISLEISEFKPYKAIILLSNLRDHVKSEKEKLAIERQIAAVRRYFATIGEEELNEVLKALKEERTLEGYKGKLQEVVKRTMELVKELLSKEDVRESIRQSQYMDIEEGEKVVIIVPDVVAYIQGSGRTSRMYAGGITTGLSIVVIDSEKAFNGLRRGIKWYLEEAEFKEFKEEEVEELVKKIDEERKFIKRVQRGEIKGEEKELVKTALLVVESPHKARTIARFFGEPQKRRYGRLTLLEVSTGNYILNITSTAGHVFDLVTEEGYHGIIQKDDLLIPVYNTIKKCKKCNRNITDNAEKCNVCGGLLQDKGEIVEALKKVASEVDMLIVATDDDSEGEKIGWDIAQVLSPYVKEIKRIRFHEVTSRALKEALQNMDEINVKMVEAQMLRRIEDRLIGFELSQKVQKVFGRRELSAGRVQTPVLGWIVESIDEMKKNLVEVFELTLENNRKISFTLEKMNGNQIKQLMKELENKELEVSKVEIVEEELKPRPPYTTDSLLKDASDLLKLRSSETMRLAQDLFEVGLITYHRTSSTRVSNVGMKVAQDYINEKWGASEYTPRKWGEEGAHECIRPTRPIDANRIRYLLTAGIMRLSKKLSPSHISLYDLIFKRFIASQMKSAKVLKEKAELKVLDKTIATEGIIDVLEKGFTLASPISVVPKMEKEKMKITYIKHWRTTTKPLFTEGSIIAYMRERGIGRPSTYAYILSTLFERGYVKVSPQKRRLIATGLGKKVYQYLIANYNEYVCEETTRKLEKTMDEVEEGKADYMKILWNLYEEIKVLSMK